MKKLSKILWMTLIIMVGSLPFIGWYIYQNPDGVIHPKLIIPDYYWLKSKDEIYSKKGIISIAGREFEIPISYVQGRFENGRIEGSVNLLYVLPDFKSRQENFDENTRKNLLKEGYYGGMLLQDASKRPNVSKMIEFRRKGVVKEVPTGRQYGLEVFKWYEERPSGLYLYSTVYEEKRGDEEIIGFIECTSKDRGAHVISPSCRHVFTNNELLYDIYYDENIYLSEWKKQKESAIQFVESFEKTNK